MTIIESLDTPSVQEGVVSATYDALSQHLGHTVLAYEAQNYRYYKRADKSQPFGHENWRFDRGALVVTCQYTEGDNILMQELSIDDFNRPFDEDIITLLGAEAQARVPHGVWSLVD